MSLNSAAAGQFSASHKRFRRSSGRPRPALGDVHPRRLCQAHRRLGHRRLVRLARAAAADAQRVVVGLVELFGGLAVLVGYRTRIAAIALAVVTLAATAIAHIDFVDQTQLLFLQKNLAIAGGFIVLAVAGAGALSLDARRD